MSEQQGTAGDPAGAATGTGVDSAAAGPTGPVVVREPADWEHFAPPAAQPAERDTSPARRTVRGLARRAGRLVVHEWSLAVLGGLALAVVMFFPSLRHPATTIPADIYDPTLQAWQMAWSGHILLTDPAQLWNSNAFFPDQYSYVFSDTLFGYFPAGLIGSGPAATLVRYNVMFLLLHALAVVGAYALVRQLGARRIGAAVAAVAFAYAPWRWGQAGHMHVMSVGGIPLCLAMLARGHGFSLARGWRYRLARPGWAIAGWCVAAWQISLGFGIGLPLVYALAAISVATLVAVAVRVRRARAAAGPAPDQPEQPAPPDGRDQPEGGDQPEQPAQREAPAGATAAGSAPARPPSPGRWPAWLRRLVLADAIGVVVFGAVGAFMAWPYLKVVALHPEARRTVGDLKIFSPTLGGLLTAPYQSTPWGDLHESLRAAMPAPAETSLLPGFALIGLAAAGLVLSTWRRSTRWWLGGGVVLTVALALGTHGPLDGDAGYLLLYRYLPGWDGIRTPGRLVIWVTLFLAVLAAGTVSALAERARRLADETNGGVIRPAVRLALLVPLLLVTLEGTNRLDHPVVPAAPAALRTVTGPVLVLPSDQLTDENVMLWSTAGWPRIVNGGSGFTPKNQAITRQVAMSFPDADSIDYLRGLGVRTVVVLKYDATYPWDSDYARAQDPGVPIDGLDVTRQDEGDVIVYQLR